MRKTEELPQGGTEDVFRIVEAYYDDKGSINGWCEASLTGTSKYDLISSISRILSAPVRQSDILIEEELNAEESKI